MRIFKGTLRAVPEKAAAPKDQGGPKGLPELSSGNRVEVLTMENHLLFVGRMKVLGGGVLELRRDTGDPLPQALYNSKVKLRGFQRNSQPFCMNGTVGKSSRDFWQIENLEVLQNRENRGFFRQNTDLDARVMPSGHYRGMGREMAECKVLDVSAGGARVLSRNVYMEGDRFQLEAELLPDERPFSVVCRVLRITPKKGFKYEYGCKFEGLSEQEQQRLLRAVFTIQRKILQAQRD
ncbi:flagellar brake protein [Oscillibacter sp. 1-3]|uniref:flagellar brake protein n=1 Tax=Oscillibacter sp. 1-3 TaxID=1235797 RepID=UPI00033FE804|nr:PilZ domain-containing protein [Oscillibacter sp. 1-3]EOS65188.1 hypothetical protein C816_02419 [Oscillibacter sp. 1-3]MCI9510904.1 PilZ domain-containing protein [Oscillibacter sp.]